METYDAMKKLSIEELKCEHDKIAPMVQAGLNFYREEIRRRESEKANSDMLNMTRHMRNMTIAISLMTLINVVAVIIQIYLSSK